MGMHRFRIPLLPWLALAAGAWLSGCYTQFYTNDYLARSADQYYRDRGADSLDDSAADSASARAGQGEKVIVNNYYVERRPWLRDPFWDPYYDPWAYPYLSLSFSSGYYRSYYGPYWGDSGWRRRHHYYYYDRDNPPPAGGYAPKNLYNDPGRAPRPRKGRRLYGGSPPASAPLPKESSEAAPAPPPPADTGSSQGGGQHVPRPHKGR